MATTAKSYPSRDSVVTSSRRTVMFFSRSMVRVTAAENRSRSTANASPAGTRASSAQRMIIEPRKVISRLRRPTALLTADDRKEFEQTSSARLEV